jgi:broad specificity phosphatase PhoE
MIAAHISDEAFAAIWQNSTSAIKVAQALGVRMSEVQKVRERAAFLRKKGLALKSMRWDSMDVDSLRSFSQSLIQGAPDPQIMKEIHERYKRHKENGERFLWENNGIRNEDFIALWILYEGKVEELADLLGTTRAALSRKASTMRSQGIELPCRRRGRPKTPEE